MIALLFIVYFTFLAPDPQETNIPAQEEVVVTPGQPATGGNEKLVETPAQPSDSAQQAVLNQKYGVFAAGFRGESQEVVLENEELRVTFDTKGARIKSVLLKDFKTYNQEPLYLLTEDRSQIALIAPTKYGPVNLNQLYYNPSEVKTVQLDEVTAKQITFRLDLGGGRTIAQTYTLPVDGFQLQYLIQTSGLDNDLNGPALTYRWDNRMENFEHDLQQSRSRSTVNFFTEEEDYEELSKTGEVESAETAERIRWAGMNHRFFTAAVIADNDFFQSGRIATRIPVADTSILRTAEIELNIASQAVQNGLALRYYFGPNNQRILNDVTVGFENNVELGYFILRPINKWLIIPTFHFLERFFTNYGIIILLLVIFIKLLLFPLSYKSYVSMAKTRVLKPQLDEIKAKHGDDMAKIQQEQMKLYSQLGINPISGCVPMLLQMPILFAMFYFFPNSIELRQESFLWANDLSTYDSVLNLPFSIPFYGDHVSLFTLLMTVSTILITMTNQQMSTVQGPMKTISYIMPVTFLFFLNSFPAGLTYYYFLSNLITYGQQAVIRKFVDDDKIKEIIEKNRLKNKDKKVSGFQARLQEALKASQEAKREPKPTRRK